MQGVDVDKRLQILTSIYKCRKTSRNFNTGKKMDKECKVKQIKRAGCRSWRRVGAARLVTKSTNVEKLL